MTTVYEVPLIPSPQRFSIVLAGIRYEFRLIYCDTFEGGWLLDVNDPISNQPMVSGIPLVTGIDILQQYSYLDFGGELWVGTPGDPYAKPTFEGLGVNSHLYFVTRP